jgi:adenylate cyclase
MNGHPAAIFPRPSDTIEIRTDETFEEALARETLRSERLRLSIIASLIGLIFVRQVIIWLFFPSRVEEPISTLIDYQALTSIWGLAFVSELVALLLVRRALRLGLRPPRVVRYVNAFVETSIPTLTLVLGIQTSSPAYLLALPVTWGYFLFIILATLRLDIRLCAFTGLVAGAEYLGLAVHVLSQPQTIPIDPSISAPMWQGMKVAFLIGGGLLAGVVSLQIRRQFAMVLRTVQDRNRVVSMFGQHVSPAVVDQLLSQDVEQGGEVRRVCVMFVDIQGFTTFAENRRPGEVVEYLNSLFAVTTEIVNRHQGIVNKFLGDGFMAIFGAPIPDTSACQNAVAAGLETVERVKAMSESGWIAPTVIRIGLHAGEAVTGNIGSIERKEYTVIGDVVNLAARLEQLNKQFGSRLLVSDAVLEQLDGQRAWATPHGEVQVKGREQPVQVYQLA